MGEDPPTPPAPSTNGSELEEQGRHQVPRAAVGVGPLHSGSNPTVGSYPERRNSRQQHSAFRQVPGEQAIRDKHSGARDRAHPRKETDRVLELSKGPDKCVGLYSSNH